VAQTRSNTTVVVIGSNSFSGSDFVDLLLEEATYKVVGISRSPEKSPLFLPYRRRSDLSRFTFHQLDVNRQMPQLHQLLLSLRPSYIVNFASQSEVATSWQFPEQWFQTNAVALAELGNFLRKQSWLQRFVHISTPEVYGKSKNLLTEDAIFAPSTPYAASRAAGEFMLRTLVQSFDFPLVVIRSANVYGAHQQLFKIIPRSFIYMKLGRRIPLENQGDQERSFIHIRDVSRGELAAMERGVSGEAYHLATPQMIRIRDLVHLLCEMGGVPFGPATQLVPARMGSDPGYRLDTTKANATLNWSPQISLAEGILKVRDWIHREWPLISAEPLEYLHRP